MSPGDTPGQPLASGHTVCQCFSWCLGTLYSVVLLAQRGWCPDTSASAGHLGLESTARAVGQLSDHIWLPWWVPHHRDPCRQLSGPQTWCWGEGLGVPGTLSLWPHLRALLQTGPWEALQTCGASAGFPHCLPPRQSPRHTLSLCPEPKAWGLGCVCLHLSNALIPSAPPPQCSWLAGSSRWPREGIGTHTAEKLECGGGVPLQFQEQLDPGPQRYVGHLSTLHPFKSQPQGPGWDWRGCCAGPAFVQPAGRAPLGRPGSPWATYGARGRVWKG